MNSTDEKCLVCERSSDEVPLIAIHYRGKAIWICPQHLPILIHKPAQLAGKLPGAEQMTGATEHD